ncbi:WG repeat-containing protein [Parapedobacter pyrenivorans]|nr:WG repeat-containing protein [Parapedobacter pyrenivorans]
MKLLLPFFFALCCLGVAAQEVVEVPRSTANPDKRIASQFSSGFAAVQVNGKLFYIDTLGKKAFDSIDEQDAAKLGNEHSINEYESHRLQYPEAMPKPVVKVWKDGSAGLLTPNGAWLLPTEYADIDVRFPEAWKVRQQGKESYYGKAGLLLPFFDEVGYLDGEHFDVRDGDRWGIYSYDAKKMVVPMVYEKFDYCGGCGRKPAYVYAQSEGKWGVVDFRGKVLIDFEYDHEHWGMRGDEWVQSFAKDGQKLLIHIPTRSTYPLTTDARYQFLPGSMLAYAKGGKFGIIDKNGQQCLPAEYDSIHLPNDDNYLGYSGSYTLIEKSGKKGVFRDGAVLFQPEWDEVMVYDDFFVLTKDGKSSLWDAGKRQLVPPSFSEIMHLNDYFYSSGSKGITVFKLKDRALYGLYFTETDALVKPAYHSIELVDRDESEGEEVIECTRQGRKALYSLQGEELLPLHYHDWDPWYDSGTLLQVQLNDKLGLYDWRQRKEVLPCAYDHLERLDKSNYVVSEVGDYGSRTKEIRNEKGEVLLNDQYNNVEAVGDGWYLLTADGNVGLGAQLFNSQTGTIQGMEWTYVWNLETPNLLLVSQDGQTGSLYDVAKANLLDGKYDVSNYSDPYAAAEGTDTPYPLLLQFQHGIAAIRAGNKIGFVDSLGRQFIAPQYDAVTLFNTNGVAAVAKLRSVTDAWGRQVDRLTYRFVASSGATLSKVEYPALSAYFLDLDFFLGDYLIIRKESPEGSGVLMGLEDRHGNTILNPEYNTIDILNGGQYFLLQQGQRFGIADKGGKIVLPVKFENMLINRYALGNELIFPLLCKQPSGWMYYTREGYTLTVAGMTDSDVFEINQSIW